LPGHDKQFLLLSPQSFGNIKKRKEIVVDNIIVPETNIFTNEVRYSVWKVE